MPSAGFDGTGIVLLLAAAIVVALIMMSDPGGDGRVGVTNTTSSPFKTPPPPWQSTSPAEPTPKPASPGPDNGANPEPDNGAAAYAGADPVVARRLRRDGLHGVFNGRRDTDHDGAKPGAGNSVRPRIA